MVLQSVMTVCASSPESNASTESTSSRTREPNDAAKGFCHGKRLDDAALGPAEAAPVAQEAASRESGAAAVAGQMLVGRRP